MREARALQLGSPKQRALLGFLLLHANEPVSRDRLVDELWGDAAPPTVKRRLAVKPLAAPQAVTVVNGGPRPLIAIAVAIFGFVGWCWIVLTLGGLGRFWRWAADPFAVRA